MTTRFPLVILLTVPVALAACMEHRAGPTDVVGGRSTEIDDLVSRAELGTAEDKYNLGVRYEGGMVVAQDYQEAVRWYRQAAMEGYSEAQYKLCELSDRGQGVPQDYQEAMRWCGLAADQGHGRAMFALGVHYHAPRGVPRDLVRAHMWYNLAAAYGYDSGKKWRDRLVDDMTPAQVTEAQKLAREWNLKMR